MKKDKKEIIKKIIFFVFLIIWMIIAFWFSNQPGDSSSEKSSRVAKLIANILSNLKIIENISKSRAVNILNPIIRKIAHYLIYTIGGIIIANYINVHKLKESKFIIYSILIGAIYAMTDEIHQYFVPGRSAQITDVILDTMGVITGVCVFMCILKLWEKFRKNKKI